MFWSFISAVGRRKDRPARSSAPSHQLRQGILASEILVDARDAKSDSADVIVEICIDFCNWCRQDAALLVEEVCAGAWKSYYVDFYLAQVNNGGHGQFAGNSSMRPAELDFIDQGLAAMGAADFLSVFRDFRSAMDADPILLEAVIEGGGFGDIPPVIQALDNRFFTLKGTQRLLGQNAAWLKSLPSWTPLELDELRRRKAAILTANRFRSERMTASLRR